MVVVAAELERVVGWSDCPEVADSVAVVVESVIVVATSVVAIVTPVAVVVSCVVTVVVVRRSVVKTSNQK